MVGVEILETHTRSLMSKFGFKLRSLDPITIFIKEVR